MRYLKNLFLAIVDIKDILIIDKAGIIAKAINPIAPKIKLTPFDLKIFASFVRK